jgi:hypothetical protein
MAYNHAELASPLLQLGEEITDLQAFWNINWRFIQLQNDV